MSSRTNVNGEHLFGGRATLARPQAVPWPAAGSPCQGQADDFRPTSAMRRYAEAICSSGAQATPEDHRRVAKVSLRQWSRWRRQPEFALWLNAQIEQEMAVHAVPIWLAMKDRALEGNVAAARLYLERFARQPSAEQKQDALSFVQLMKLAQHAREQEPSSDNAEIVSAPSGDTEKSQPALTQDDTTISPSEKGSEIGQSASKEVQSASIPVSSAPIQVAPIPSSPDPFRRAPER